MFKKHEELKFAVARFLSDFADRRGWEPNRSLLHSNPGFSSVSKDGVLTFSAMDYSKKLAVDIAISLIPHSRVVTYLVSRFLIEPQVVLELLEEQDVFTHHGKYLALEHDDSTKPLHGNLWEINCPANLEALFRAYDNLARSRGKTTIFNLP